MSDDLAYWGATDEDAAVLPPPEMRRIGERLFVRPRGFEGNGAPLRLPLRLHPDFMRRAVAEGNAAAQLALIVDELTDETARTAWLALDMIDREAVIARYFFEVNALLGMAAGESSR